MRRFARSFPFPYSPLSDNPRNSWPFAFVPLGKGEPRLHAMRSFTNQLQQVARRLMRAPMFTMVTLVTLAVGIGANSAIFSVINGVLLKPLPYDDPDRIVGVWHTAPGLGFERLNASPASYFTYREESHVFEKSGIWRSDTATITGLAEPEQVDIMQVTFDVLPVLRIQPVIGRGFSEKDDTPDTPETVLLSYGYWQRKFGDDPQAVGKRLIVEGRARDIIGILPQSF